MKTTIKLLTPLILLYAVSAMAQPWVDAASPSRTMFVGTADKTIFDTRTETSLIPTTGIGTTNLYFDYSYANRKMVAGTQIDFDLAGAITSSTNDAANTCEVKLKIGKYTIATTGAVPLPSFAANATNAWQLKGAVVFRSVGATGTAVGMGNLTMRGVTGWNTNACTFPLGYVNVASPTVTIGTTTNTYVDVTATFAGGGDPADDIPVHAGYTNMLRTVICRISTTR